MTEGSRRRWPRRAAVLAVVLVLLAGGVAVAGMLQSRYQIPSADLFNGDSTTEGPTPSSPTPPPGADITGPLNILLVGVDTRVSVPDWQPHADAVLILHVSERLDRAYLISLPRDLLLEIPPFPDAEFGGGTYRLLSAMTYGSRVPGQDQPDPAQGFALLAQTVNDYTGIARFDAGAVLTFGGFTDLVDAVGGVEIELDQRIVSEHREPDGSHREILPGGGGYQGPQKVYEPGTQHLSGWEALDVARQRYLPGGDYTRQRHQRQLIRALVEEIASQDLATDPVRLDRVLRAVGDSLVFDGRGYRVVDFAYALRGLRPGAIVPVGLPGDSLHYGGSYQGEQLEPVAAEFFTALVEDRVERFLADHSELVDEPEAATIPSG